MIFSASSYRRLFIYINPTRESEYISSSSWRNKINSGSKLQKSAQNESYECVHVIGKQLFLSPLFVAESFIVTMYGVLLTYSGRLRSQLFIDLLPFFCLTFTKNKYKAWFSHTRREIITSANIVQWEQIYSCAFACRVCILRGGVSQVTAHVLICSS